MRTPPDGSEPCPGCTGDEMHFAALVFNAMNRLGEPKMMAKIWDLRCFHPVALEPTPDMHPAIAGMHRVHARLLEASQGMALDGQTIRWLPGVSQAVNRVMDEEARPALIAYEEIKDEHNRDERHCRIGGVNRIREQRGSHHTLWGARPDTSYHHFVACAGPNERPSLLHKSCGRGILLAEHFLENLRRDPTFYGAVNCPHEGCRPGESPWYDFEIISLDPVPVNTSNG